MKDDRAPQTPDTATVGPKRRVHIAEAPPSVLATAIYWFLPAAWMAFIFYRSSWTSSGVSTTNSVMGHLVEYGTLAFLLVLAAAKTTRLDWRLLLIAATVAAALYGASDELHQAFVPGRTASLLDWVTDVFGVLGVTLSMDRRFFKRPPSLRRQRADDA